MEIPDPIIPAALEIKTRSIEQTLLPLVKQISTLVSHRERPLCSDRSLRAVARVGQAVNLAVERFVTVGETIADDNPEIKQTMYDACKEARVAGGAIEKLCECAMEDSLTDRGSVVRAARCLLGSVTRVLLLADIVVVKQLLLAKDKVARSLGRLESVSNFTEFVKAFSQFGAEMVELAHLTGDRQNDLKDERRRAQMAAARQVLERSTMMLLTSSKACLRHPECTSAKENRDTVFCQMRRAMDLIHYVVKDGVLDCNESQSYSNAQSPQQQDWDSSTVSSALKNFERMVETTRMTLNLPECRETLTSTIDTVVERTQDFTDSAYTSHEHRENILLLCDRVKLELNSLLRVGNSMQNYESGPTSPNSELDQAVLGVLKATRDLRLQLATTTMEQAGDLGQVTKAGQELVSTIRNLALASEIDRLQESSDRFHEYIEHILEVCKLLRHIALSESLQVSAKFTEINLRIYGPQVVTAAHTLARYPTSKIAKENLEVFADMWQWLMSDVTTVAKDVLELCQSRPEKQVYMSLPRPGKHGTTSKPLKPVRLDSEEQAKIAKAGLEMKLITSEMDAETEKWQESGNSQLEENNDIVKRAKNMSSMAFSMYQFTRGEGALKTTQDLFTQAEYFAEEANRLYKVVRQFSYQVPGGPNKKDLLENLDRVPTYVQQLQFTVKNPTVGKAATFTKVDNVIQETKNLMNIISKVVTTCFECATKYNLDFRGLSARGSGGSPYRGGDNSGDGDGTGVGADGSKSGSAPGSDPSV
ncbi:Similar to Ctnnal1: Alpha-catulin (Mus musculus) [Cotesia congregata]|uniref:Similar to Ctnnal1: Alpha-catulin (Mus musculus) n=1 Tax=Cotesia congregata TaxID=51543 RepID=A0A8J2HQ29_COTCN|nr:Similar to Ctnnal1: Alpha-catulin (Mus musculus) [Cotesia congregata]